MGWKVMGAPTVRRQRDRWVVRVDGIDTETGKHRPKQLGTYPSQRAATVAARSAAVEGRAGPERGTVSWLVRRWVASRTDVSQKTRRRHRTRHRRTRPHPPSPRTRRPPRQERQGQQGREGRQGHQRGGAPAGGVRAT